MAAGRRLVSDDRSARLGDLIAAVFDEAARLSDDPREVSKLATQALAHLLHNVSPASEDPPLDSASVRRATARVLRLIPENGPALRARTASHLQLIPCGPKANEKPKKER
jgi:hypothetical protein